MQFLLGLSMDLSQCSLDDVRPRKIFRVTRQNTATCIISLLLCVSIEEDF